MGSKATVYLDPKIYKAVKAKAAHTDHSLSYVVNEAFAVEPQRGCVGLRRLRET